MPEVQQVGSFTRECQSGNNNGLLCKWCGPRNYDDVDCPKQKGVNILDIKGPGEEVLVITRLQTKKALYLDLRTEKERLQEPKAHVERAMMEARRVSHEVASTLWVEFEKTIMRQMMQATVLVWVVDLLQTMSQLKVALNNAVEVEPVSQEHCKPTTKSLRNLPTDPMLLTVGVGRKSTVVEMEIMGRKLIDTIVDGGSGVNVLP